ncbi:MAG: hypothetical protein IJ026_03395 [Candidatus Methanomethylophilaceae archaeon]|nr:hypothetical protein [Candidatus Methanomethylophilaceae archaeon]
MRFTTARLCGGKALMAVPSEDLDIDMSAAREVVTSMGGDIVSSDDMMMVYNWNGMETTLYSQGKIMFYPLEDKPLCIRYATETLEKLV